MEMIQENIIHALKVVPSTGSVWVATQSGLMQWNSENNLLPVSEIRTPLTCISAIQNRLFVGGIGFIAISEDIGLTWQKVDIGIPSATITAIESSQNYLVASTLQDGVLISEDGKQWRGFNFGLLDWQVLSLAVSPEGKVFAGTESDLFKSSNGGRTWQLQSLPVVSPVLALAHDTSALWVGTEAGHILQSDDDGISWEKIATASRSINAITVNDRDDVAVLAGDTVLVFHESRQQVHTSDIDTENITTLAWQDHQTLLVGTATGIVLSIHIEENRG